MDIRRRVQIGGIKNTSSGEDDVIPEPIINTDNYLTIEALEDGLTASLSTNTCEYCIDADGNWKTLSTGTATESINSGHTLSFRGNLTPVVNDGIGTFTVNKNFNLKGNCMSMLFGDDGKDNFSLAGKNYAFQKLFYNCAKLQNVSDTFLPALTLSQYCYNAMFYGCSITKSPTLVAPTLMNYCYYAMFYNCTNLNYVKICATTNISLLSVTNWMINVSPTGTFVKHPDASFSSGTSGIPSGWTVVNYGEENGGGNLTFPVTISVNTPAQQVIDFYNYIIENANGANEYVLSDDEIVYINRNGIDEQIYSIYYTKGDLGYIEASLANAYYVAIYSNGSVDFWD